MVRATERQLQRSIPAQVLDDGDLNGVLRATQAWEVGERKDWGTDQGVLSGAMPAPPLMPNFCSP